MFCLWGPERMQYPTGAALNTLLGPANVVPSVVYFCFGWDDIECRAQRRTRLEGRGISPLCTGPKAPSAYYLEWVWRGT